MSGLFLRNVALVLLTGCLAAAVPVRAGGSPDIVYLESRQPVVTWEEDAARVFVAGAGATIRQGNQRLAAPRVVAWLDKGEAAPALGRAVVLRVYAQGVADELVALAEGQRVRHCGAVAMEFVSGLSLVSDCPLARLADRQDSPLLAQAEAATADLRERTFWDEVPPLDEMKGLELATHRLRAEQVHAFGDESCVVYLGDVHGTHENLIVRADEAVLWADTERDVYEIYARGNVRISPSPTAEGGPAPLTEAGDVFELLQSATADELYINPNRARALITNSEVRVADEQAPEHMVYIVRADKLFAVNSSTLEAREASITTCPFARPHYRFAASRAQVTREATSTFLTLWDARFQVGEEPHTLLRLPFIGTDLTARAYVLSEFAIGSSDKYGFFAHTAWRPLDLITGPACIDHWTLDLDYYADRGTGLGSELSYGFGQDTPSRHEGELRAYYISDDADEDDTGLLVPETDRGRFHARHRWRVNPDWRVDAEYYWLSDEGFLNEYFEPDFEGEKIPESYVSARYLDGSAYLALLYKRQVNDFVTQLEQAPSADLQLMGMPWGRLVYDGTVTAGYYSREDSDLLPPAGPDPPGLGRFHTQHRLSLPFTLGVFRLDPAVRALATAVRRSAFDGAEFGGSESRTGLGTGITASTSLSRVFPASSELFDLNRLRHVIIPHAGVESLSVSGAGSDELIQMDDVDALDTGTVSTLGLRQRLETKRMRDGQWEPVNWMELDVALVNRSSDSVAMGADEDYVNIDFEMALTDNVSVHSRDNRLGLDDLPDVVNFGARWDFLPAWELDLDYDRIEDISSTVTAELSAPLSDRYRLLLYQQYEFDSAGTGDAENLETRLTVRRILDQWVLDVGVRHQEAKDDFAVVFGFGPRGWGLYGDRRRAGR